MLPRNSRAARSPIGSASPGGRSTTSSVVSTRSSESPAARSWPRCSARHAISRQDPPAKLAHSNPALVLAERSVRIPPRHEVPRPSLTHVGSRAQPTRFRPVDTAAADVVELPRGRSGVYPCRSIFGRASMYASHEFHLAGRRVVEGKARFMPRSSASRGCTTQWQNDCAPSDDAGSEQLESVSLPRTSGDWRTLSGHAPRSTTRTSTCIFAP